MPAGSKQKKNQVIETLREAAAVGFQKVFQAPGVLRLLSKPQNHPGATANHVSSVLEDSRPNGHEKVSSC